MKTNNTDRITNSIIGAFLVTTYLLGLFLPVTSDAGKYAAISRMIYETGDWINLSIHYEPYLQKPPLLFWITTPSYFIFGLSEFSFKLPVLLYSGIALYSTYRFSLLYYKKETALMATLMLSTCEFYFLFHNDIHTDSLLTANVIFAVWQIAEYLKSSRFINIFLGGVGIGLAMISKGPIGIFVPATATLFHLILQKKITMLFNYKVVLSGIALLLIVYIGMLGAFNQFGWEGIRFFLWDNNAGRITGELKGSSTDYFFYFHTALYIFLPWGFLFFIAFYSEIKKLITQRWTIKENEEAFSFGAIFFYWIILSIAKAKSPHYIMVIAPFMSVISAKWISTYFHSTRQILTKRLVVIAQYITIVGSWLLLLVLCLYCFPTRNPALWIGIFILAILSVINKKDDGLKKIIKRSVLSVIALNFAMNLHVFPQLFSYQSVIPACAVFNKEAEDPEKLSIYRSEHRELFFYADNPGHFLYNSEDLKKYAIPKDDWIYTNSEGLKEIEKLGLQYDLKRSFKHRSVTRLTAKYLNPKTREQSLNEMHLIQLVEK